MSTDIKTKIVDLYRIIKLKNLPNLEKFYFDIAISIGGLPFIELLTNTGAGSTVYVQGLNGFNRRTLQALDVLTNDKSLLVKWCAQRISEPISPKYFVVEYLNIVYQLDKDYYTAKKWLK